MHNKVIEEYSSPITVRTHHLPVVLRPTDANEVRLLYHAKHL